MPWIEVPLADGTMARAHVCVRGRRPKSCQSCGADAAKLECDGPRKPGSRKRSKTCDAPICHGCAVSPEKGKDFCPKCAEPAFRFWVAEAGGWKLPPGAPPAKRSERRNAFRVWVRANANRFYKLIGKCMPNALCIICEFGSETCDDSP